MFGIGSFDLKNTRRAGPAIPNAITENIPASRMATSPGETASKRFSC